MHKIVPGDMEKYIVKLLRNPLYPKLMVQNQKKITKQSSLSQNNDTKQKNKQTNKKKNRLKLEEKHT